MIINREDIMTKPYLLVTMKDGSEIVIELEKSPCLCAFLSAYRKLMEVEDE